MKPYVLLSILFGLLGSTVFGQTEYRVRPSGTDPAITSFDEFEYAYPPEGLPQNRLFVFLPGTGGFPAAYREVIKTAARIGCHAVGVMYPNDTSFAEVCGGISNQDPLCFRNGRHEVFDGVDRHPVIEVDGTNSIRHRLWALLTWLHANHPTEGWNRYVAGTDSIRWELVKVAGHSQGAGHAGMIARQRDVARSVMFAGMDIYSGDLSPGPAQWIAVSGPTPAERLFGFTHFRDPNYFGFGNLQLAVWADYGMAPFGPLVNVDTSAVPYIGSHQLTSDLEPAVFAGDATNYHGACAVTVYAPRNPDGTFVYTPLWEHLIGRPTAVWPGDANNSGAVTVEDFFFAAGGYGRTGYVRSEPGIEWKAYGLDNDWPTTSTFQGQTVNDGHLDANGDGTITLFDVAITLVNRGLTH